MIDELFKSGKTFAFFPLRAYYLLQTSVEEDNLQFGCGASKKHFKKAVDRNRIKRLIREVYRVEKGILQNVLIEKKEKSLRLFVIYTGKELPDYYLIKEKMLEVLGRIKTEIKKEL